MRTIVLIVSGAILLGWVVFCGIQYVHTTRRVVSQRKVPAHVVCDECDAHFDVDVSELMQTASFKSRSITRTKREGAALVEEPEYSRFAKKVYCPHCGKRVWANVTNINELNKLLRQTAVQNGLRWLAAMVVGGALVFVLSAVAIGFANQAAEQRTEELHQQLEDNFRERYGID